MKKLFENSFQLVILDEQQRQALDALCAAFEADGIEYMPLKGAVLKSLYPRTEMRVMGDIDILIKTEQYEKVSAIMENSGYSFQYESDHELVWGKDLITVELHKSVMTSYNKDFYAYFGDGWNLAKADLGTLMHSMSDEHFYIYIFLQIKK